MEDDSEDGDGRKGDGEVRKGDSDDHDAVVDVLLEPHGRRLPNRFLKKALTERIQSHMETGRMSKRPLLTRLRATPAPGADASA
jgi:hypothetical protein